MGDLYRVIVIQVGDEKDETLFELAGSAARVAKLAPTALIEVLAEDAASTAGSVAVAERVMDAAREAGAPVAPASHPFQGEQPKRKRRTKAEIAADEEAQAAGFRDAAHRAEVEATQQQINTAQANAAAVSDLPPGTDPLHTPADQAAPAPVAAPVPQVTPGGEQPYNPFEVK